MSRPRVIVGARRGVTAVRVWDGTGDNGEDCWLNIEIGQRFAVAYDLLTEQHGFKYDERAGFNLPNERIDADTTRHNALMRAAGQGGSGMPLLYHERLVVANMAKIIRDCELNPRQKRVLTDEVCALLNPPRRRAARRR